jgi:hypothetical protein
MCFAAKKSIECSHASKHCNGTLETFACTANRALHLLVVIEMWAVFGERVSIGEMSNAQFFLGTSCLILVY